MDSKYTLITILLFIVFRCHTMSQAIFEPHYALKTPETINLVSIEASSSSTVLNLSIKNLVNGGYFCVDPKTFLVDNNGRKYLLQEAVGIPFCPEVHRFKAIGEMIYFTLTFPPVDPGIKWLDLVEECGDMCFSVLGITIDKTLNNEMNKCFTAIDAGKMEDAASMFEALLPQLEAANHGLTGSLYVNLVIIYETLNDPRSEFYRKRLEQSNVPYKDKLLEGIRKQPK